MSGKGLFRVKIILFFLYKNVKFINVSIKMRELNHQKIYISKLFNLLKPSYLKKIFSVFLARLKVRMLTFFSIEKLVLCTLLLGIKVLLLNCSIVWADMCQLITLFVFLGYIEILLSLFCCLSKLLSFFISCLTFLSSHPFLRCLICRNTLCLDFWLSLLRLCLLLLN